MKINKTQSLLIEMLEGKKGSGRIKDGWTRTVNQDGSVSLTLQKLNQGDQAHKMAAAFPDKYKAAQLAFRLVRLTRL
jgi:hypothetical protein